MQRSFTSNLALCATLSLAQASRLLIQNAIDGMSLGEYAVMTDSVTLAQTMQQTDIEHSCTFVMDRHKNTESADFYDIVNAQSTDYLDEEFPTNDAHYFFDGGQNDTKSGMVSHASKDSWHRIKDGGYFKETLSLFGDDYIRPEDIRQGEIGNCWYLSSITALAEYPGRIESAFLNKTLSQAGVYGVQMYALGVPVTVMVDDYLPLVGSSGSRTRYSKVGGDGSLWGPIMEKAFAKFHGNYARIVAGDPVQGVSTMNGSPYERIWSQNVSQEALWEALSKADDKNDLMQAGTQSGGGRTKYGLVRNHAYAILGVHELSSGEKLIHMRNPWGNEGYNGQYKDSNMSQAVKDELDHENRNEGTFWMTVPEFVNDCTYVGINYNTENWYHDYFLVLDDNRSGAVEGSWNFCGQSCSRYTVRIENTSSEAQQVHVGAHTWRSRSYAETDECMLATYEVEKAHSIYAANGKKVFTFWNDARWMDPIEFKAGEELVFYVELDLERDNLSPDWAISAWGESGEIKIRVDGKEESDKFPYVKQDHSRLPANEGQEDNDDSDGGDDDATNNEKALAAAKKAEEAAEIAREVATSASYIMQTVEMKKGAVAEQQEKAMAALLNAQLQMERAKKALEDALICCGLTASDLALGEETTLEQLAAYIKVAKEAAAQAEKAYHEVKAAQKVALDEKASLDEAYMNIKSLAQDAEDAMMTAEAELAKIQKLPGDTPEQQDALNRAQNAYEAAEQAWKDSNAIVEDAKKQEEEADKALKEIQKAVDDALKHASDSNEAVKEIQKLIDERVGGDEHAEECANDVENLLADAKEYKYKAYMKEEEVYMAEDSILNRSITAAENVKKIDEFRAVVEEIFQAADETNLTALENALIAVKEFKKQADLLQNGIEFEYNTAKFEVDNKLGEALGDMIAFIEKIRLLMEAAYKQLEQCEKYNDTDSQLEDLERAKAALEAIVKLYQECQDAEVAANKSKATSDEVIGTINTSNNNAQMSIAEIEQVIEKIKILIKAAGGGDDDDCDMIEKFQKIADQHLNDHSENHVAAKQYEEAIGGLAQEAAANYMIVMDIMNFGADTLELAKQDKDDPDLLQFHMETVKGLAFEAETAADRVKSVKDSAVEVKETAFKLLLQDISDLSVETEEQMAAFEELAKALEMVHETFEKAMMKKDEAMGLAESADKSIGQASENVDMAENCKEEINVYIEKIQMLIDGEDLPDDDDDDDDNDDEDLLNDWLETFEPDFAKKCHQKSVLVDENMDLNALGFAHMCGSAKKMLSVQLKGKKGVKVWSDKIVSTTHPEIQPNCEKRNINKANGFERCTWTIFQDDGKTFGINFDSNGVDYDDFQVFGRIKNLPKP